MAHIGALRALEREEIPIAGLSGSSYGAVIAALYALYKDVRYVEHLIRGKEFPQLFANMFDFGFHRGALVSGERFRRWLDAEFFFGATFDDVQAELAIATTDLAKNELHVIRSGSIAEAIQASCALPGFFAPTRLNGKILIDGGFVEPIPFRALAGMDADVIIGVQAGLNVQDSAVVRNIRSFNASGFGQQFHESAISMTVGGPLSQVYTGISVFLRSYDTPIIVPPGAHLFILNPNITWIDFGLFDEAVEAGDTQFTRAFRQTFGEQ